MIVLSVVIIVGAALQWSCYTMLRESISTLQVVQDAMEEPSQQELSR
jgi:hypothetical protein